MVDSNSFRKTLTSLILFNLFKQCCLFCKMMLRPMFLFQYLSEVWFSDLNFFSLYVTINLLYLDIYVNDMSLKWKALALVEVSPLYSFSNIKFKLDSTPNPRKRPCLPAELLTHLLLNNRRKQNNH